MFNISYYYWFKVSFTIGLDFLFIIFLIHFFLSWTYSLSISSSAISASTLSNYVLLGLPTGLLPSTLNSIHFITQSSSLAHKLDHSSLAGNSGCQKWYNLSELHPSISEFSGQNRSTISIKSVSQIKKLIIHPIIPLLVHQPAYLSIWPATPSLQRGVSTNPGVTVWCVCGCS